MNQGAVGPAPQHPGRQRRLRIAFALLVVLCLALVVEGGARLAYWARGLLAERGAAVTGEAAPGPNTAGARAQDTGEIEAAARALDLDPYEIPDLGQPGQWRLRPDFTLTLGELIDSKRREGRVLALRFLEESAARGGVGPEAIAIRINKDGFRGPEIDHTHAKFRILALGDSCTFGPPLGESTVYPRVLERELTRLGLAVEVINGGVEGYSPGNALLRAGEYRALRPEITTLYLGWNAFWGERFLQDRSGARRHLYSARLVGSALERARQVLGDRQKHALEAYERPKRPDRAAPDVRALDQYTPSFMPQMADLVEAMRAAGSRVIVMTLPGLFVMDEDPSPRALEVGHLPTFTDNPFVLARMAERYNEALRSLARDRSMDLIDLDRWSRRALRPRDAHFFDSVHLYDEAQERLGVFLAQEIAPFVSGARQAAQQRASIGVTGSN